MLDVGFGLGDGDGSTRHPVLAVARTDGRVLLQEIES